MRSSSPFIARAVRAITGRARVASSRFSSAIASRPSIPGSWIWTTQKPLKRSQRCSRNMAITWSQPRRPRSLELPPSGDGARLPGGQIDKAPWTVGPIRGEKENEFLALVAQHAHADKGELNQLSWRAFLPPLIVGRTRDNWRTSCARGDGFAARACRGRWAWRESLRLRRTARAPWLRRQPSRSPG